MISTEFGRWRLEVDVHATQTAYASIESGSPERCGCYPCLNFAANREHNFPTEIRAFLETSGIPIDREAEIYHNCKLQSGKHSYGGWFHLIGRILSGGDAMVPVAVDAASFDLHDFGASVLAGITTKTALVDSAFASCSVLQLEFSVEIPWVIKADEAS